VRRNTAVMLTGITLGLVTLWSIGQDDARPVGVSYTTTTTPVQRVLPTIQPPLRTEPPKKPTGREAYPQELMVDWCRYDLTTRLQRKPSEADLRKCTIREFKRIDDAAREARK
jgi:hypothetical protein